VNAKGKQFLLRITHSPFYSYMYMYSPLKVLSVIEERQKNYVKRIHFVFEICIYRNGQPDRDDDRRIVVAMNNV